MKMLAIKAENISKQYRLGEVGTGTLSHDLNRFWHKVRGKEDPYLKIGESNDRSKKGESDYVWSLRDINFEIEQGDAVGIIGRNGAGKSTLLKILSKVTKPTTGSIKVNGRIASLLEVGTGFNPEMTGRENIYLNGAILGMRKHEITRKLDEIIDFSGVERYIDTPVKRYSSGMYVRLAFAVAAHLESEILIVDEVLAVGDTEFQKKCLGKMGDVSTKEGRTVLFVSHNMESVLRLCKNGLILQNGKKILQGDINSVVQKYLSLSKNENLKVDITKPHITYIEFDKESFIKNKKFELEIHFSSPYDIKKPNFGVVVKNKYQMPVFGTNAEINNVSYSKEFYLNGIAKVTINQLNLLAGEYYFDLYLVGINIESQLFENVMEFEVMNVSNIYSLNVPSQSVIGSLAVDAYWSYR